MKTNNSYALAALISSAALLLMLLNAEAIVITTFIIGFLAIAVGDYARAVREEARAARRLAPAQDFPLPAQSLSARRAECPAFQAGQAQESPPRSEVSARPSEPEGPFQKSESALALSRTIQAAPAAAATIRTFLASLRPRRTAS